MKSFNVLYHESRRVRLDAPIFRGGQRHVKRVTICRRCGA